MKKNALLLLLCFISLHSFSQTYTIRNYLLPNDLETYHFWSTRSNVICIDNKTVWVGTSKGAAQLVNNSWTFHDQTNGLQTDTVYRIVKDYKNNIWLMGSNAVQTFKENQWNTIEFFEPNETSFYRPHFMDITSSSLYYVYNNSDVLKITPTDTTVVTDTDYNGFVTEVEDDQNGTQWLATEGAIYYNPNGTSTWSLDTSFFQGLDAFHIDQYGYKWITQAESILYKEPNSSNYKKLVSPTDSYFHVIDSDKAGNVYFGTWYDGIYIKTKGEWLHLNTSIGLIGNYIIDMEVDDDGNVWILSSGYNETAGENQWGLSVLLNTNPLSNLYGKVFIDTNNDGTQNTDEGGIPNQIIRLNNMEEYAISDQNGNFSFSPIDGQNTIELQLKEFWEQAVTPISYSFDYPAETLQFSIGLKWKEVHDAAVSLNANAARPGFNTNYYIHIRNEGSVTENLEVTLQYDPVLTFISSNEEPTTSSDGHITFNINDLKAQQGKTIELTFNLPVSVPLETLLSGKASITSLNNETDLNDNVDSVKITVTGSFDPNDKLVKEGILEEGYVKLGKPLTYTIRFQNTGTDYAFNIKILDTLDPHFDLATLEVLGASHNMTYTLDNRTLKFLFNDIMLPDSTNNEPASHGYVTYRIKPHAATLNNTVVLNSAAIYFDFNEPVVTNEVSNLLVTKLPSDEVLGTEDKFYTSVFYPNPVTNLTVHLKDEARQFHSADLISLNGVALQHFNLQENAGELKLNTVPAGIYLLKFTGHQKIKIARLIITE